MRKTITLILAAACVLAANGADKANKFAVKSGYVKYNLTGNTTGTETLYWDNYGEKTRTEINSKTVTRVLGIKSEDSTHTINVLIKDKFWDADLIAKEGYTGKLPYYNEMKENVENMSKEEQEQFEKDVLASLGGRKQGTEDFIGYKCDIITVMGTKSLFYKGVMLKSEINIMGNRGKKTAVEFKPGSKVDAKMFKPYGGVKYTDVSKQQQGIMGGMFNMGQAPAKSDDNQNTGLFGMLGATVAAEDMDDDMDNKDDDLEPIEYPFANFKEAVSKAKIPAGYNSMGMMNVEDESYMATYMGGMSMLMISAVSNSEADNKNEGIKNAQKFKHKGREYTYGELDGEEEDEEGTILFTEFPKKKIAIMIVSMPKKMTKDDMLKIAESLDFK